MKKQRLVIGVTALFLLCLIVGLIFYSYFAEENENSNLDDLIEKMLIFINDDKCYINISISRIEGENNIPINNISKDDEEIVYIKLLMLYLKNNEHSKYDKAPLDKSYDIYIQGENSTDQYSINMIIVENGDIYIVDSHAYYEPANAKLIQEIVDRIK